MSSDERRRYQRETRTLVARRALLAGLMILTGVAIIGMHDYHYASARLHQFPILLSAGVLAFGSGLVLYGVPQCVRFSILMTQGVAIVFLLCLIAYLALTAGNVSRLALLVVLLVLIAPLVVPWGVRGQTPLALASALAYAEYWFEFAPENLPITRGLTPVMFGCGASAIGAAILDGQRWALFQQREQLLRMRRLMEHRHRMETVGETAAMIAHRVARQLATIGILAHLADKHLDGPGDMGNARKCVAEIQTALGEATRVFDDLRNVSEDQRLDMHVQSLTTILRNCVTACRPRAKARNVRVELSLGAPVSVLVDQGKLEQALLNVLDNAIEVAPRETTVDVEAEVRGDRVAICVRDHGTGIDASVSSRVFHPLVTTKRDGFGLGLAITKGIVELHGGTLTWAPAVPGTAFTITLPLPDRGMSKRV